MSHAANEDVVCRELCGVKQVRELSRIGRRGYEVLQGRSQRSGCGSGVSTMMDLYNGMKYELMKINRLDLPTTIENVCHVCPLTLLANTTRRYFVQDVSKPSYPAL